MKKLGLVGGTGPESTIPYYKAIVYGVKEQMSAPFFPQLVIDSVDVFQVLAFCARRDYAGLADYISASISHLAAAGADFAALTGNTPHIVFEMLQERSPIPLVSMVQTTCQEAHRRRYRRLALLGTAFTMEQDFFKRPFLKAGIDILVPTAEEQRWIHQHISDELELGIKKENTLAGFQRIIWRMKEAGQAEAVILGCTELPLLLDDSTSPLPCLDTMAVHIEALIQKIITE